MSTREVLAELHDEHGGLTPSLVLDVARDPQHELHGHFLWDDTEAAERYRLDQSRSLIRSFRVVYRDDKDEKRKVPQYVNIETSQGPVYRKTEEVVGDDFQRKLLMQGLERDLNALTRKYGHLDEFASIVAGRLDAA